MDEHMERCLDHMYMIASNNGLAYPNAQKAAMDAYMEVREENVKQRPCVSSRSKGLHGTDSARYLVAPPKGQRGIWLEIADI
jgi:S-adenosylmethionine hydrolase